MRFRYYDMYENQFEDLVVAMGSELLGPGIQPFSTGPDGGRDARFVGTAAQFPSSKNPLSGKFILQAKHTESPVAKFSEPNFSGNTKSSILKKEIPRIKSLVEQEELDNYMLFSNRRLGGQAEAKIRKMIQKSAGSISVELFGIERIDSILKQFPNVETRANLSDLNAPMLVHPDNLAAVIVALAKERDLFAEAKEDVHSITRTSFKEKNAINKLTPEFAKTIQRDYLPFFEVVKSFLANPYNENVLKSYIEASAEFNEMIIAHRHEYISMDQVMTRLQYQFWQRDPDLAGDRRLTKLVMYYMYWNCDFGLETSDA